MNRSVTYLLLMYDVSFTSMYQPEQQIAAVNVFYANFDHLQIWKNRRFLVSVFACDFLKKTYQDILIPGDSFCEK